MKTLRPVIRTGSLQAGLSLVEVMVALMLSLLLIAGVGQIYLANKQTYFLQEAQSRLQETGRYALELLTHDIRLAGYFGCANIPPTALNVIANPPLVSPTLAWTITGGDNSTGSFTSPNPALSGNPLNNVVAGTDALTVQFGESCGGFTSADINGANQTGLIMAGNTCSIDVGNGTTIGDPLVIADCQTADIFRAASDNSQNTDAIGGATIALSKTYRVGSQILPFRSYTYYIRLNPNNQPSLYRLDNNSAANAAEMAEGVEDMQILYGVDTDGDRSANQYFTAAAVPAWNQVVDVGVSLLLRSLDDNLLPSPQTYTYNGANVVAADRRLRQVFTTTIGLRNELR